MWEMLEIEKKPKVHITLWSGTEAIDHNTTNNNNINDKNTSLEHKSYFGSQFCETFNASEMKPEQDLLLSLHYAFENKNIGSHLEVEQSESETNRKNK